MKCKWTCFQSQAYAHSCVDIDIYSFVLTRENSECNTGEIFKQINQRRWVENTVTSIRWILNSDEHIYLYMFR